MRKEGERERRICSNRNKSVRREKERGIKKEAAGETLNRDLDTK